MFSFARSGQARINELLRRVNLKILRRSVILTVAQQEDSMKRPRDARTHLQPEGILVFGHENAHRRVAEDLGIHVLADVDALPDKGEFLAARVVPAEADDTRPTALLEDQRWALARPDEPRTPGPRLPRASSDLD